MRPDNRVYIQKMRLSEVRVFSWTSRLPYEDQSRLHCQRTHFTEIAPLQQYHLCFLKKNLRSASCFCKISSTVHWRKQTTNHSWLKARQWQTKSNRGGLDCASRHSTWSTLGASKSSTVHSRRPTPDKIKPGASTV